MEPKTAAFTGFTSTGANSTNSSQYNVNGGFNGGYNFYTSGWKTGNTIFFAGFGRRDTNTANGNVYGIWGIGHYWTAGASTNSYGRYLHYGTTQVFPQHVGNRSFGLPIRFVKE